MTYQYRIGFKGRNQLPWFMIWVEEWESMDDNTVLHAWVIFNSMDWGF